MNHHPTIVRQMIQERYREAHRSARAAQHSSVARAHRGPRGTDSSSGTFVRQVVARLTR